MIWAAVGVFVLIIGGLWLGGSNNSGDAAAGRPSALPTPKAMRELRQKIASNAKARGKKK
jgi:hypothetical protein